MMPVAVRSSNFEEEVLQSRLPVLLDFFGERCAPCRLLQPILLELSEAFEGQLKFCLFNTDREPQETDEEYEAKFEIIYAYNLSNLPTMLLFAEGALKRVMIGLHSKEELLAIFAEEGLKPMPRPQDKAHANQSESSGSNQKDLD